LLRRSLAFRSMSVVWRPNLLDGRWTQAKRSYNFWTGWRFPQRRSGMEPRVGNSLGSVRSLRGGLNQTLSSSSIEFLAINFMILWPSVKRLLPVLWRHVLLGCLASSGVASGVRADEPPKAPVFVARTASGGLVRGSWR